jgi:hypothetical protein
MLSMLDGRAPLKHWRDKDDATKELAGELALQTAHPLSKKRSAKAT